MWLLLNNNLSTDFSNLSFEKDYSYLIDLKKINIFVGKNNGGKSYLMRKILKSSIKVVTREEIRKFIMEDCDFNNYDKLQSITKVSELRDINDWYLAIMYQIMQFDKEKIDSGRTVYGGKYSGSVYNFNNYHDLIANSTQLLSYLNLDNNVDYSVISDEVIYNYSKLWEKVISEYHNKVIQLFDSIPDDSIYRFGYFLFEFDYVKKCFNEYCNNYHSSNNAILPYVFKNYIPIMRSIRHPLKNPSVKQDTLLNDIYKDRIIKEYQFDIKDINIITGLDFYTDYKKKLLGTKNDRHLVSKFETFLSNYFFEGKNVSIIPDEETFELKINIEDSDDRFVYQVGDGISSLIILIFHAFLNSDKLNNIYFIEEPEQSFHPGFQRLFMNIISMNDTFKNCFFFFTTHSNHLIDISSEFKNFQTFLCSKIEDTIRVKVLTEADIEVFDELGVNPSSVQIANKLIWVEGKYDALYIRLLMNKKNININKKKYIEGYDFAFVPYGGTNMVLINFSLDNDDSINDEFITKVKKINPHFMLIMDDDGIDNGTAGDEKIRRYERLNNKLKSKLYKLKVREIENLFPEVVVKDFFQENLNGKFNRESVDWSFVDNICFDDYKDKKLGSYLNSLVAENLGPNIKKFTNREKGYECNGFLYNKSKFYDSVIKWIMSVDFNYDNDVPEVTKNLIDDIERFIKSSN